MGFWTKCEDSEDEAPNSREKRKITVEDKSATQFRYF